MATIDNIIDFFERNKDQVVDFMDKINVNHYKTVIKYGFIEDESVSINCFVQNQLDASITDFNEKLRCLFNAEIDDFNELGSQLKLDRRSKISFSPFLKINDSPLIHAFHITVKYQI